MSKGLFREKSVERITSPEQLNDYVKVAGVNVWIILTTLILLLAGVFVWGVFGQVNKGFSAAAYCYNGVLTCYISDEKMSESIKPGVKVRIDGTEYTLDEVSEKPQKAKYVMDDYTLHTSGLSDSDWVYCLSSKASLSDGTYRAYVLANSEASVWYVLN